ncbi:MAG: hypothetical protein ACPLN2_10135, partial [Thermoproteota archaeon]
VFEFKKHRTSFQWFSVLSNCIIETLKRLLRFSLREVQFEVEPIEPLSYSNLRRFLTSYKNLSILVNLSRVGE